MTFTQKLIQFVMNHWVMVGGFVFILILLFIEEARSKGLGTGVSVHEAINLINREEAIVIDIREANSFLDGHIIKARNISKDQIDQNLDNLKEFKERPIIIVCDRGQSSVEVAAKFRKAGFEKAQSLQGGMVAWSDAMMPLKKGK